MSDLPKTIWYCPIHKTTHLERQCPKDIELRVAGRDDLLIRREDIDYEAAKRAAFEVAEQIAQARYEGQRFSLTEVNDLKVRAAVDAALAAAEGGEGS